MPEANKESCANAQLELWPAPSKEERVYIRIGGNKISTGRLKRFADRIRQQRGKKCERCGQGGNHVHHIFEKALYPMLALIPENVLVLCIDCHRHTTQIQRKWPDFTGDFYARFPAPVLQRIRQFRERVPAILRDLGHTEPQTK